MAGSAKLKLTLISNDPLNFNDATLASRFIKIFFRQSFFGNEDGTLRHKLEAEISGIANRCMAAYRRLLARATFSNPRVALSLSKRSSLKAIPTPPSSMICLSSIRWGWSIAQSPR